MAATEEVVVLLYDIRRLHGKECNLWLPKDPCASRSLIRLGRHIVWLDLVRNRITLLDATTITIHIDNDSTYKVLRDDSRWFGPLRCTIEATHSSHCAFLATYPGYTVATIVASISVSRDRAYACEQCLLKVHDNNFKKLVATMRQETFLNDIL